MLELDSSHLPLWITLATLAGLLVLWLVSWWLICLGSRLVRAVFRRAPESRAVARAKPWAERFAGRFPRLAGFIAARFDPSRFTGLPLTLLALLALVIAAWTSEVVEDLLFEPGEVARYDAWWNAQMGVIRGSWLEPVFVWITGLGETTALGAVAIVASGFAWALLRPTDLAGLWLTVLGSQTFTWLGKYLIARPRPEFLTEVTAVSPSFPSAHASGSMAVYAFVAYLISRQLDSPRKRFEVCFWAAALILLVGLSRTVLSVHYASDVLAGFLVGGFWFLAGFTLAEYGRSRA